jgi:hypothetical protein
VLFYRWAKLSSNLTATTGVLVGTHVQEKGISWHTDLGKTVFAEFLGLRSDQLIPLAHYGSIVEEGLKREGRSK